MPHFKPLRLATTAAVAAALVAFAGQTADAGLFAKLKAKLACHKAACCEPEPACDPCAAPVVEDCGCGGEVMVMSEGVVMEASPSEAPTPADPAPEPPAPEAPTTEAAPTMEKKEGSGTKEAMTEKQKRIAAMKAEATAAVKKAAAEGK